MGQKCAAEEPGRVRSHIHDREHAVAYRPRKYNETKGMWYRMGLEELAVVVLRMATYMN